MLERLISSAIVLQGLVSYPIYRPFLIIVSEDFLGLQGPDAGVLQGQRELHTSPVQHP